MSTQNYLFIVSLIEKKYWMKSSRKLTMKENVIGNQVENLWRIINSSFQFFFCTADAKFCIEVNYLIASSSEFCKNITKIIKITDF